MAHALPISIYRVRRDAESVQDKGAARYGNGDVTREEERSSVSEDARPSDILDEATLCVQGCDAKQEPGVESQVARVRISYTYVSD